MSTITVFKAKDGKWAYCPTNLRNWPAFANGAGQYDSKDKALEAIEHDDTLKGAAVKVESGFFGFG